MESHISHKRKKRGTRSTGQNPAFPPQQIQGHYSSGYGKSSGGSFISKESVAPSLPDPSLPTVFVQECTASRFDRKWLAPYLPSRRRFGTEAVCYLGTPELKYQAFTSADTSRISRQTGRPQIKKKIFFGFSFFRLLEPSISQTG